MMNKELTEIVFILDRSGSMSGLESDTIGGYNALLEKQKEAPGDAIISTILFDDRREVLHNRLDIKKVKPLTQEQYFVRGCTALLDAVGGAIDHIESLHKEIKEANRPEKTIFVITTDGMENASCEYGYNRVKWMIERQKEREGWEFIFLGANIDAIGVAESFGISADHAANYHADSEGTKLNYKVVSEAICNFRSNKEFDSNWKNLIDQDYEERKSPKERKN